MGKIYEHPDWSGCIYWEFDPVDGWEGYHQELDQIAERAKNATEPFIIIFEPSGDIPRGNPITHMRRIVQVSKSNKMITRTIIMLESNWFIAKAFANLLNKVMLLEPEVKLVFGIDEARKVYEATLLADQKKSNV